MHTQCTTQKCSFKGLGDRRVEAQFTAGRITTDTGGLLVREVAEKMSLFEKASSCFTDYRDPDRREHEVDQLLSQRVMGLALGYEDLNDHDELRSDPTWATLAGKEDPTGQDRTQEADQGKPLAGKSTLGRLENSPETEEERDRYHQITADPEQIEDLFTGLFVEDLEKPKEPIVLDLDATHDPLHGIRYTESKRATIFTGTTTATAICRSTFSAGRSFCARSYGGRTSIRRKGRFQRSSGS